MITNLIVTAYCACHICCGSKASGITASGLKPVEGITVAASRSLPFGTRIIIDGHTYKVQDRLAKRYDNRIDIYMVSHRSALSFGKQIKQVTIIK